MSFLYFYVNGIVKNSIGMIVLLMVATQVGASSLEGSLFLRKDDGEVLKIAGEQVVLLSYSKAADFLSSVHSASNENVMDEIRSEIISSCEELNTEIDMQLKYVSDDLLNKEAVLDSKSCGTIDKKMSDFIENNKDEFDQLEKDILSLREKIKALESEKSRDIKEMSREIYEKNLSGVVLSNLNSFRSKKKGRVGWWVSFTLENKTGYCLKSPTIPYFAIAAVLSRSYDVGVTQIPLSGNDPKNERSGCILLPFQKVSYELEVALKTYTKSDVENGYFKDRYPVEKDGLYSFVPVVDDVSIPEFVFYRASLGGSDSAAEYEQVDWIYEASLLYESSGIDDAEELLKAKTEQLRSIVLMGRQIDNESKECLALVKEEGDLVLDEVFVKLAKDSMKECNNENISRISDIDTLMQQIDKFALNVNKDVSQRALVQMRSKIDRSKRDSKSTFTDRNGDFKFEDVDNGRYLLFVEYKDLFYDGYWLEEVSIKEDLWGVVDRNSVNLNHNQFVKQRIENRIINRVDCC